MNQGRIKLLEKYLEEDPSDNFSRYALALELAQSDQNRALGLLLHLVKNSPQYLPAYYQAALLLLDQNQLEETRIILDQGAQVARQQKDMKTLAEIKQLADELD